MGWIEDRNTAIEEYFKINGEDISDRRSGRSTGRALEAIGMALQYPNRWIEITDHFDTPRSNRFQLQRVLDLIKLLNLDGFSSDHGRIKFSLKR